MIKKFLVIILVLCVIFMLGSVVFAGGNCEDETPEITPTETITSEVTPIETPTKTPDVTTENPSETIIPSEEKTSEPSETSEVSNSPENTPGQETAQASINPTSTKVNTTLPKTGEGPNFLIYGGGCIILAGLNILIFFRKKLFN